MAKSKLILEMEMPEWDEVRTNDVLRILYALSSDCRGVIKFFQITEAKLSPVNRGLPGPSDTGTFLVAPPENNKVS